MKRILSIIVFLCLTVSAMAQQIVSGTIVDATTGETLIGANILFSEGVGTYTDFDGNFTYLQSPWRSLQCSPPAGAKMTWSCPSYGPSISYPSINL